MAADFEPAEIERLLVIARQGARKATMDVHLVEEAAGHAVQKLCELYDKVAPDPVKREAWLRIVARNYVFDKKRPAREHEIPFGKQGSAPPRVGDERIDAFVKGVIHEMNQGEQSVSAFVALRVDFERAWAMLSEEAQSLLGDHFGYDPNRSHRNQSLQPVKKMAEKRGRDPRVLANQITRAKAAARPVFRELYDQLRGGTS